MQDSTRVGRALRAILFGFGAGVVPIGFSGACAGPDSTEGPESIEDALQGIGFVQVAASTPQSAWAKTVLTTPPAPQNAGNLNLVAIGWQDGTHPSIAVTDSIGNAYKKIGEMVSGRGLAQVVYYAPAIKGGTNTIKVSFGAGVAYPDVRVLEYTGVDPTAPIDAQIGKAGTSRKAWSGQVTTTTAGDVAVGLGMASASFTGAGAGYTKRIITSPNGDIAEDMLVASPGTIGATAPLNTRSSWVMQVVALRPASSASGTGGSTSSSGSSGTGGSGGGSSSSSAGAGGFPEGNVGIAAKHPGDVSIASDPAVIFADDFESYAQASDLDAKWDAVFHTQHIRIATEPTNVFSGGKALEFTVPQQNSELSNATDKLLSQERDVLFLRYYSKFQPPYDVVGSSHNGAMISAHYFIDGQATPGVPANGTNKFLVNLEDWRGEPETPSPGLLNVYVYHPEQRSQWGDHFFPSGTVLPYSSQPFDFGPEFVSRPDIIPELDRWYCYEYMVQANTPGKRDGRIAFWVDGKLAADFQNLRLRDVESLKIDRFGLSFHIGSNPKGETKKWYDDVVAASAYIGPRVAP